MTNPMPSAPQFWDGFYADHTHAERGPVNRNLIAEVDGLEPGTALDLGCGEGADAIWLAEQGWQVTGVDISPTAIRRASEAASGLEGRARFVAADLSEWSDPATYDLVAATFLHSPVTFDRTSALRRAADRVGPGGHLLVVSHAAVPPWADVPDGHHHRFLSPSEEIDALDLDPAAWDVRIAEIRTRPATTPDGEQATLDDSVILLRRR